LGFSQEGIESKYYADGEDALHMKLHLGAIGDAIKGERALMDSDGVDEAGPVGSLGKAVAELEVNGKGKKDKVAEIKVKIGRGLGVGELVERNESKKS